MHRLRSAFKDERIGLYGAVFLVNMSWGIMSPILADLQVDFGVPIVQLALANSAFGLARLVLNLPIGLVMDRFEPRLLRTIGSVVWIAGLILCGAAADFTTFVAGRLVSGVGAAIALVTTMVWISRLSNNERRGRDLGIYQALLQASMSVSLVTGGVIAGWGGWRASFWFAAAAASFAFVPILTGGNQWIERMRGNMEKPERPGQTQVKTRLPVGTVSALVVANLVTFVMLFSASGFQDTVVPLYGRQVLLLDPTAIGVAMGVSTVLRFVMSLVGGELSDRVGRRALLIPGLIVVGLGGLLLNTASDLTTFWLMVLVLSLGRFGNNLPATVLADHAPRTAWSFLLGLNRSIGDLGMVLGPICMGLVLESYGYGMTTIFLAAMVWFGALTVAVGVTETQPRQPVFVLVRTWLQTRIGRAG